MADKDVKNEEINVQLSNTHQFITISELMWTESLIHLEKTLMVMLQSLHAKKHC